MRYNRRHSGNTEVKEYLMSLIGSAPYGLLAIDLEGNITIANGLAKEYLRLEGQLSELVDQPLLPLTSHIPIFEEIIRKCLEQGRKPFDLEYIGSGDRYVNIKGRLILNGLLITIEDITNRVIAEQRLKVQAEELATSNKELEEFAYLSSHDMKSPILSLEGLMNMMEKNKAVKPEFSNLFEMARNSTHQMRKTIMALNEIIAFRKTLKLEAKPVDVGEVWQEVLAVVQQQVVASGVVLHADFSRCPTVWYPPVHLKSILQNLLTNAIKYRREDAVSEISVSTYPDGRSPVLEFSDNGLGIDLKLFRSKLYGLFQRFHTHTEGMGIGLHMIASIVRSYNGKINIKSKPGHGTTFKIHLSHDTL
ncbi:MAG: GHKL domain-containing protein [Bacteroidetes bacterium]|nr:GHKL domain-containing protein [Bacteroidota bacterium]